MVGRARASCSASPTGVLPEVRPSCGRFGRVSAAALGADSPLSGVPISAMAGDQHAALFGQACFNPGMTKATFGTGSFVLMNAGPVCPAPVEGLVTTLAWDLGTEGDVAIGADGGPSGGRTSVAYALEGSVFVSGAGVQWLRDELGMIDESSAMEPLARSVASSEGVVVVPAFTGLGSPFWDPGARGTIVGLSRGLGRAHLARAMVEAMGFQVRDVVEAMAATATAPTVLRVDGGASAMALLLQLVADQTGLPVVRPRSVETTALGAATLAGLAEGLWGSLDDLADLWTEDVGFGPDAPAAEVEAGPPGVARRRRAVEALDGVSRPEAGSGRPPAAVVGDLGHGRDPLTLPVAQHRVGPAHHQDGVGLDHGGRGHRVVPVQRIGRAGSWPGRVMAAEQSSLGRHAVACSPPGTRRRRARRRSRRPGSGAPGPSDAPAGPGPAMAA